MGIVVVDMGGCSALKSIKESSSSLQGRRKYEIDRERYEWYMIKSNENAWRK